MTIPIKRNQVVAITIAVSVLFAFALIAHAEDALWNTAPIVNLCNAQGAGYACASRLINPNITIKYHIKVTDDAGTNIAPGSTVPTGSTLHFSFVPHTYEDVYWFGTGFSFDSPYGEWRADAAGPPITFEDKDYISTIYTGAGGSGDTPLAAYRPLVVNPPVKSIGGLSGFGCGTPTPDGSVSCTPQQGGTFTPQFDFGDTYGYFYWRFKNLNNGIGVGDNIPLVMFTTPGNPAQIPYYGPDGYDYRGEGITLGDTYTLIVPPQSIPYPITVVGADGSPPATPTLTSSGQCIVGTPHTISMVSTDPDSDTIRYGIDWDADGSVNEWVPPSGYVSSGTAQTASRTYAIAGTKTVRVRAQDQSGLSSGWATISFNCTGSSGGTGDDSGSLSGLGGTGDADVGGAQAPIPVLSLRVMPSLVNRGETTQVHWGAENVVSCTVSGQNGDGWSGLESPVGGKTSSAITARTTYTLTCRDADGNTHTKTAWVGIAPNWRER